MPFTDILKTETEEERRKKEQAQAQGQTVAPGSAQTRAPLPVADDTTKGPAPLPKPSTSTPTSQPVNVPAQSEGNEWLDRYVKNYKAPTAPTAPVAPVPQNQAQQNQGAFSSMFKPTTYDITKDPVYQKAQSAVMDQLSGSADNSIEANQQREALKQAQYLRARQLREQMTNQGLRDTGQYIEKAVIGTGAQNEREAMDLERTITADAQNRKNQQLQQGIGNAGNLLNMQQQGNLTQQQLAQQAQQSTAELSLREKEIAQQGKQFDSEMAFKNSSLAANLSEAEKQRVWQAIQNEKQITSTEKLGMANLSLREKEIAQQGKQFDSEMAFKNSSLAANLSEAEKQRVWQAMQNEKQAATQIQIANMNIDADKWKTTKAEELTKLGWTKDEALAKADRELKLQMQEQDAALQREIESGRLKMQDKQLIQDMQKFGSEMDFKKSSLASQLSEAEKERLWKTKMQIDQNAFTAKQTDLQMQFDKEIESGRLKLEDKKLLQDASQFKSKLEFDTWATQQGLSADKAKMIWQSSEAALDRAHNAQMSALERAMTEKGMNFSAMMSNFQNMSPQQQAQVLKDNAIKAGLTYIDENGKVQPGIKPLTAQQQQQQTNDALGASTKTKLEKGTVLTSDEYNYLKSSPGQLVVPPNNAFELNSWYAANVGKPYYDKGRDTIYLIEKLTPDGRPIIRDLKTNTSNVI